MPIFSTLAAIGGAIGSAITGAAGLFGGFGVFGKLALSVGLNLLSAALNKKKQAPQAQGSEQEVTYGEDLARSIALGRVALKGTRLFNCPHGESNSICSQVFKISDFPITSIERVLFEGEWRTLAATPTGQKGLRVLGVAAEIYVNLHVGSLAAVADPYLVSVSGGRWTANHRGAGIAYVVVTSHYSQEHLPNPADLLFEIQGAPLYDMRKDDTVGGTGAHRWADQSTWEYSANPALMIYALERGFSHGDELIVGKGINPNFLVNYEFAAAAQICDEIVDGEKRYQAGILAKASEGATHDGNITPLVIAMAGNMINLVDKVYPVAGASRPVVATITDDDLVYGQPLRVSMKKSRSDLANFVSGTFIDPAKYWQTATYPERIDLAALGVDGERLAKSLSFSAVHSVKQAQRLADIQLRNNRFQANADIVLRPRWLVLEPGDWINWQSGRFGWTKTFEVQSRQLGSLESDQPRIVSVSLEEINAAIFDGSTYGPDVGVPVRPADPVGLAELSNPQISPVYAGLATGERLPAINVTWLTITDPTVESVYLQWRPRDEPSQISDKVVPATQSAALLQENIVSQTVYQVRHKILADPPRATAWSTWENGEVLTFAAERNETPNDLLNLAADVRGVVGSTLLTLDELKARIDEVAGYASAAELAGRVEQETLMDELASSKASISETKRVLVESDFALAETINVVQANVASNYAAILSEATARVDGDSALSSQIFTSIASIDTDIAQGYLDFESSVSPDGTIVTIDMIGKVLSEDDFSVVGFQVKAEKVGGVFDSQILVEAKRFIIIDSSGANQAAPFLFENGGITVDVARFRQAIAEGFTSPSGKVRFGVLAPGVEGLEITT